MSPTFAALQKRIDKHVRAFDVRSISNLTGRKLT